jgi:hypothetical protein
MPTGILVEVAQLIDFFQAQNTTLYATTMDYSSDSSLRILQLSHIHFFLYLLSCDVESV